MAAPMDSAFEAWLSKKLQDLNPEVDLEVFVSYIMSILETETTNEDKLESLAAFIGEITEEDVDGESENIISRWEDSTGNDQSESSEAGEALVEQFRCIVEKQQNQKLVTTTQTSEESARKKAILAQYGHLSDGETTDDDPGAGAVADLSRNVNALSVKQRETETRDRMKQDHDNKKQKDREDREKQKQKVVDRKENEKKRTQKGEKRR